MSRKLNPRIVAGTVAGLAVAGGGAAVAATQFTSPKQDSQAVVNDAAKQLGVKPAQLSDALKTALENRVDAAVAAGRITKQQGAELKQRIESGDVPLFAGPGFGNHREWHHFGPFGAVDAAATFLGLTQTQLETKLEAGKTLAAIAKDEGKSSGDLVAAMVAALQKRLDAAVTAGGLTKAQEASILAGAKARMTDFVSGKEPAFRGDRDGDHGFGFGPPGGGPPSRPLGGPGI
jgi:hypothetical protein